MNFYLVLRHHTSPIVDHARVVEHLAWMPRQHRPRHGADLRAQFRRRHRDLRTARFVT